MSNAPDDLRPDDLRKDGLANLAVLAGFGSGVVLTAAVISRVVEPGYVVQRSNPVHWLLMGPIVVWVLSAANWKRWALAVLPAMLVLAPVATALLAIIAASPVLRVLAALATVLSVLGYRWRQASGLRG